MEEVFIGGRRIAPDEPPYFIADIAANHDGELDRALHLIELAKESGADAAKFQNFKAEKIVSDCGFSALNGQLSHQKSWRKPVFEVYRDATLPDDWTPVLKSKCESVGIEYMTSPYDFASADWADRYVNCFKIGSGDISWGAMLEYIAKKGKPVLLATGAADAAEVDAAVHLIRQYAPSLVLMQCNTNYTAEQENFRHINLRVLSTYHRLYPDLVLGLSDHTIGYTTVLGAIALGARVVEKHFTDDNDRIGPDHKFSTTPEQWKEMVRAANELYLALGDGIKRIEPNEQLTSIVQKRSLYLTRSIRAGEILSDADVEPLRPRNSAGFGPNDSICGKHAMTDLREGEALLRKDVE